MGSVPFNLLRQMGSDPVSRKGADSPRHLHELRINGVGPLLRPRTAHTWGRSPSTPALLRQGPLGSDPIGSAFTPGLATAGLPRHEWQLDVRVALQNHTHRTWQSGCTMTAPHDSLRSVLGAAPRHHRRRHDLHRHAVGAVGSSTPIDGMVGCRCFEGRYGSFIASARALVRSYAGLTLLQRQRFCCIDKRARFTVAALQRP